MITDKKQQIIKCPKCGAEYLPAEIFLPDYFLGKPLVIDKDPKTGEIIDFTGICTDGKETYKCDFCNTHFIVNAKINFGIRENTATSDAEYTTKLKQEQYHFNED